MDFNVDCYCSETPPNSCRLPLRTTATRFQIIERSFSIWFIYLYFLIFCVKCYVWIEICLIIISKDSLSILFFIFVIDKHMLYTILSFLSLYEYNLICDFCSHLNPFFRLSKLSVDKIKRIYVYLNSIELK